MSPGNTLDPFEGPDCCVTLPVHSTGGAGWPVRVTGTAVPTVFTELILFGTSIVEAMRLELQRNVAEAVKLYLCPKGQRVWYVENIVVIIITFNKMIIYILQGECHFQASC